MLNTPCELQYGRLTQRRFALHHRRIAHGGFEHNFKLELAVGLRFTADGQGKENGVPPTSFPLQGVTKPCEVFPRRLRAPKCQQGQGEWHGGQQASEDAPCEPQKHTSVTGQGSPHASNHAPCATSSLTQDLKHTLIHLKGKGSQPVWSGISPSFSSCPLHGRGSRQSWRPFERRRLEERERERG